jgi:MFS family permease
LYYQFIPPVLKTHLGFDAHALGLFVGLIAFWLALATGVGIKIVEYFFSIRQMLFFSLYLVLFGLLLSLFFININGLLFTWIAAIPTAVGDVIAYSCLISLYSDVVDQSEQGKVMGICFIVVAVIWALTALLGGILMSISELVPLIVAPLGVFLSLILLHSKWRCFLNNVS